MSARRSYSSSFIPSFIARRGVTLALASFVVVGGCVQKAYDRTIVYEVDVSAVPDVQTVGLRGADRPLSWREDTPLSRRDSSAIWTTAITYRTGRLATEVKFTVNGEFEFKDAPNRTVRVPKTTTGGDTTVYRAVFNTRPPETPAQ